GGEDDVVAGSQVFGGIDALFVLDAHFRHALFQLRCVNDQAGQDFAVQAAHGGGGGDTFRRGADAPPRVHTCADHGGGNAGGKIAIGDQTNASPGFADAVNQFLMARTVQHHHHKIFHVPVEPPGDSLEILFRRRVQVHHVFA